MTHQDPLDATFQRWLLTVALLTLGCQSNPEQDPAMGMTSNPASHSAMPGPEPNNADVDDLGGATSAGDVGASMPTNSAPNSGGPAPVTDAPNRPNEATANDGAADAMGGSPNDDGSNPTPVASDDTAPEGTAMDDMGDAVDDASSALEQDNPQANDPRSSDASAPRAPDALIWPIDCIPEETCFHVGYPDTDKDGQAHDCGPPEYDSHEGTDISISWDQMDAGVDVFAAAAGEVLWVFDGKYDRCPDDTRTDCQTADYAAGSRDGWLACTELGPYCTDGAGSCYWCFAGGNVIVIRHYDVPGVFATRYDHLRKDSIVVSSGDQVEAGQKIAEVGSAGSSTGPHLHFEVWGSSYYDLADPWAGPCGPNEETPLWAFEPPWSSEN